MPSGAAVSEEERRYRPHFVWADRPCTWILAKREEPLMVQASQNLVRYVKHLSGERTWPADFFNILLECSRSS